MHFDFQQLKPLIQQEFDDALSSYPTAMTAVAARVPADPDPAVRKRTLFAAALEHCDIHIFPHFPFAFEIDCGRERDVCYNGIGQVCLEKSGVDFSPLHEFRRLLDRNGLGSFNDFTDFLHRTLDHDKLLRMGFKGVYEECHTYNLTETDPAKKAYRELVMELCLAVRRVGEKFRARAVQMLEACQPPCGAAKTPSTAALGLHAQLQPVSACAAAPDEDVLHNLRRIAAAVNTPWEPPVTLFDAMTSLLRTSLFISGFDGVEMNCYGQIDRLLFPYYENDLDQGRITEEEADFLVRCFLFKTDAHAHHNAVRKNYDNGVTVMIGGCDMAGNPVYNPITKRVLAAYAQNPFIQPKLNARASAASPREYLEELAALMRTGNNNLIVENDDYIIPMFLRMGLRPEDARRYAGNGCQEVICPNQLHSRAFTYLNLVQILLDTLHYGRSGDALSPDHEKVYAYGCFEADSFPALYRSFLLNLRSYIRVIADAFAPYEKIQDRINLETLLSAFTDDCMARGRDLLQGGARYNHKTLAFVGFGTLCDSLLSLKRAYEQHTLDALLTAMKADFQGFEPLRRTLQKSCDRFGHSESADAFARQLAGDLANVSKGIYNAHGIEWHTSLFTYYRFEWDGRHTGATPDGRHAGQTFSRQMNMAVLPDLTSAARSMSALADAPFDDVGIFDLSLPLLTSNEDIFWQAFPDYIRTCLELRIPVLQANVTNYKELLEERAHKGSHPDLVVRVCGYSAMFTELSPDMQDEIIARAAQ